MSRCVATCVSTGKRCRNKIRHGGHCGVHGQITMRFRDYFSDKEIPNTPKDLHNLEIKYTELLDVLDKEYYDKMAQDEKRLFTEKRKELSNKYHIEDAYLFFDEDNQYELEQLSGNNAVIKFAKHLGITPRHLIKLCPEIPDIEEIGVHQIYSLLRLNFNHAILNMMNEHILDKK